MECRWCKRKLWLLMIVWWLLILRLLFTSVPSTDIAVKHQEPKTEHLLGLEPEPKITFINKRHVAQPEHYGKKCLDFINKKLKEFSFPACLPGQKHCEESFNCHQIINGDPTAERKIQQLGSSTNHMLPSDQDIKQIASNCDDFFEFGSYVGDVRSEIELNFPLAYSILVYKDAGQVEQLLRSIYQPNNVYCFHIDQKASKEFKEAMEAIANCFPNVMVSSRSVRVIYAGFSRLYADILCMKDLVKSTHHWKYLINLAGTAMPIKTNWEIVQILWLYNGSNDIEGLPLNRTIHERFSHKWIVSNNSTSKYQLNRTSILKRPPPHGLAIVRGSAYGAFSRAFVDFVLGDKVAKDLLEWSMDTYSPDEHYWATLQYVYHNPQLRTPGGFKGPPEKRAWISSYSSWPVEEPCFGLVTARTSPCVFGVHSLPELVKRPELFVNKFSAGYEPYAQVCLAANVQLRTMCPLELEMDHYLNISFVKNKDFTVH